MFGFHESKLRQIVEKRRRIGDRRDMHDEGIESRPFFGLEDSSHGFLQLSFEKVFEKAHDADLWIGTGAYINMKTLIAADARYASFKPARTGNVYTNDARRGSKGGSEFLELGYLRPDIILKDLVKIAHPELLPEHELYFHKKLD